MDAAANPTIRSVDPRTYEGKFNSKEDWFRFLAYHSKTPPMFISVEGYFLQPYKQTSMRFIKDFLGGGKELIKAC
jgi:hypothetical protein